MQLKFQFFLKSIHHMQHWTCQPNGDANDKIDLQKTISTKA